MGWSDLKMAQRSLRTLAAVVRDRILLDDKDSVMAHTVVVRLTASGRDDRLRGVAEDVPTGTSHRFTTEQELVELLRSLAADPQPSNGKGTRRA